MRAPLIETWTVGENATLHRIADDREALATRQLWRAIDLRFARRLEI
jgi:hypothetical protein